MFIATVIETDRQEAVSTNYFFHHRLLFARSFISFHFLLVEEINFKRKLNIGEVERLLRKIIKNYLGKKEFE